VRRAVWLVAIASIACGKSGPPLPPLVRVPAPPANATADRRGATVDLRFTVPAANTDNTHPANIERVDIYAITGPGSVTDDQLLKRGTKIGSVDVKAPKDPDKAADEDEPVEDAEPSVGTGLDQGVDARMSETLTAEALKPVDLSKDAKRARPALPDDDHRPLVGPPPTVPTRVYAMVGVSPNGKRGPWTKRLLVPLVPPPQSPPKPTMTYDEKAITVTWTSGQPADPASSDLLPSRPIGVTPAAISYNVYDVSAGEAGAGTKLTTAPIAATTFTDQRMAWGEKRCYIVRAVETVAGMTIESGAAEPECRILTDTFPPAPPANLKTVASEGVINLIWDGNAEGDLAGYLVFRGTGDQLTLITPTPIQEPHFEDKVQPGRYVYAVKAVDRAGNASEFSNRQEETAR
jgi:hypothetical protein